MQPTRKQKALRVPLKDAETVRKELLRLGKLDTTLKLIKDNIFLYIPLLGDTSAFRDGDLVEKTFQILPQEPKDYKELLQDIPPDLFAQLPTSYDIIGSILLIKLNKEFEPYESEIGKALLNTHPHCNSVCCAEPIIGEYRTRTLKVIAGNAHTETTHTEYGLHILLDPQKVYFSPRLSSERHRISQLIQSHEFIIDLFTGVAPFPLHILKKQPNVEILAIDKNPEAINYARQNLAMNHCETNIHLICDDSFNITKYIQNRKADRILMNLPFSASDFFSTALSIAQQSSIIHYYTILDETEIQSHTDHLKNIGEAEGWNIKIPKPLKIKTYSPNQFYMVFDITAKKHADVA